METPPILPIKKEAAGKEGLKPAPPIDLGEVVTRVSNNSFDRATTSPYFKRPKSTPEEEEHKLTAVDFFGVPAEKTNDFETFQTWFEPRFGSISSKQDWERVSRSIWEAIKILEEKPYILSPRRDGGMGLSRRVKADIGFKEGLSPEKEQEAARNLFESPQDIWMFFRRAAVDTKKNPEEMLSPERKTVKGAEKLSVCRILSVAYVLEVIRNNQDFKNFFKNACSVIQKKHKEEANGEDVVPNGEKKKLSKEAGMFPIMEADSLDILDDPGEEFRLLEWLGKEQVIKNASIIINNRTYAIPELRVGVKGGLRAFLKVLRDPKAENLGALDDFFRMTFVLGDDTHTEDILGLLEDIEEQAKNKKDTKVSIEFRSKNYFSQEELGEYFPEVVKKEGPSTKKDREAASEEGQEDNMTTTLRSGVLEKIKIHSNPHSGKGFKNISMKVSLRRPGQKDEVRPFFSFEVQVLRKSEMAANRNLEWSTSHFTLEMRQAIHAVSRVNGKLKEAELLKIIQSYLSKEVVTKKIPGVLVGQERLGDGGGKKRSEDPIKDLKWILEEQ